MPTHYQLNRARGDALAALGTEVAVTRGRFLWLFKEPDFMFRKKIIQAYTKADAISGADLGMIFYIMFLASAFGAFVGQALWRLVK